MRQKEDDVRNRAGKDRYATSQNDSDESPNYMSTKQYGLSPPRDGSVSVMENNKV